MFFSCKLLSEELVFIIIERKFSLNKKIFALSVERKSEDMRKQKKKQEKLIYKMLPKIIVERVLQGGEQVAETFDQATLYFSSVDGFNEVSRNCK